MINYLYTKILNLLRNNNIDFDEELILYGLTVIIKYTLFFIVPFFINVLFHTSIYFLIFFITFYLLRVHWGGIHFQNTVVCTAVSILTLTFIPLMIKNIKFNSDFMNLSIFIMMIFLYIIGPVDCENKRLNHKEKAYHKCMGMLIILLCLIVMNSIDYQFLKLSIVSSIYFELEIVILGYIKNFLNNLRG